MSILAPVDVARRARQAGFTGPALITALAIAAAESGLNAAAVGDVDLTERGERSVGLWQINWRPSRDQPGGLRDPNLNLDPFHNAVAAYAISGRGTTFTPWSTFTSGAYRSHLTMAAQAVLDSQGDTVPNPPIPLIGIAITADGQGYVILASDGAVYCFGTARYDHRLVVGPAGEWEVA